MPEQQRRYLLGIATNFQETVNFATEAQYRRQLLQDSKKMRPATLIVNANSELTEDLEKGGQSSFL